ncbi:MAG TPA: enolase C-terminal domain-like protein [Candidatus Desulfaltia sp.]|nr:enolase C-terminal domain-like protein [Candidatus Desulfaltia sp.]
MKRREFMGYAMAAGAALGFPRSLGAGAPAKAKIDRIDIFPVIYPTAGYFKFFGGPGGSAGRAAVIVKITADNGTVGWGQAVPLPKWGKPDGALIPLSWTVNVSDIEDVGALVDEGKKRGYRHFNIKVAPDPDFDAALAREVRRLAPETFLWADANGGYELETALKAAPRLADVGVDVLESPLRPNRISGYQALKKQGALPILMDEGVVSPTDIEEFIKLGMLDGVAMKPARCGGLASCRRQVEICLEHGLMWLGSGLTDPDISLAASLCLYGSYGLKKRAALNGPQFLTVDVLKKPLRIENGFAPVPTGLGLGIDVDEDKVIDLMNRSSGDRLLRS